MKLKYLIIVGLILAIITVGAVSAADDSADMINATDDENGDIVLDNTEDDVIADDNAELNFTNLQTKINSSGSEVVLENNYTYDPMNDEHMSIRIAQDSPINTVDGQGHSIDGNGHAAKFIVEKSNVTLKNIVFKNFEEYNVLGHNAIELTGDNITFNNCTFEKILLKGTNVGYGDLIEVFDGENTTIDNCTFKDNTASNLINIKSGNITDCVYINNEAELYKEINENITIDNGPYDFFNVTVFDCPDVMSPDEYPIMFVQYDYIGTSREGKNIKIVIDGIVCYDDEMKDEDFVRDDWLERIPSGVKNIKLYLKENGVEYELYNGTINIDYYMGLGLYYGDNTYAQQIDYGNDNVFYLIHLPKGVTGNVSVSYPGHDIPNVEYDKTSVDPKIVSKLDISNLSFGKYTISASISNDPKYSDKTLTFDFEIIPKISVFEYVSVGETGFITVEVPQNYNGNVEVWNWSSSTGIDKMIGQASAVNGIAKVQLPSLEAGSYQFLVNVTGDYNVSDYVIVRCIANDNAISSVIASDVINAGDSVDLSLKTSGEHKITVYVDGNQYKEITLDGNATEKISGLALGEHQIKVYGYGGQWGDDIVYSNSFYVTVNEKPPAPTPVPAKIVAKDLKAYYNKVSYSVTVYGTNGLLAKGVFVTFKVNGKKVGTAKTNAKGIAKIKLSQLPKTYKITSTALGKSVTKKLIVKQVLTLKKAKVKRSAKKLVLTATLKEGKKAISGKKITFKFKGKKIKTVKTNKKGIAKVTIKKSILKKLKKGKKVTYQATYIKDTVKRTVKVKK